MAIGRDNYETLFNLGTELYHLGHCEEAITCWEKALQIQPDYYQAWGCRGDALSEIGCYEEAVCSYNQALTIQPDYYDAWYGRGNALADLGHYEVAIDSYRKALRIQFNFPQAWTNLGRAQNRLGRYERAILSCNRALQLTHNQLWQAWDNRGWALYYSQEGYHTALKNWNEGLQQICPETPDNREGCGVLHYDKGYAHYDYGQQQLNPYPYLQKARSSYQKALKFLTMEEFPELYLEVLHDLIKVYLGLGKANEAKKLLNRGTVLLEQLIADTPSEGYKLQLSRKFYRFYQLRVDIWVRSGNFQKALELAEERKNLCLRWLRENRYIQADPQSPKYITIQQLLNPHTAAIYWHVSPAAITTFILRHNHLPQVHSAPATADDVTYPTAARQLRDFENWVKDWKENYQDYRKQNGTEAKLPTAGDKKPALKDHPWRKKMTAKLEELKNNILDIPGILPHLSGIRYLILIPHRDLHLLPLHYLFPEDFTITYLPSAQIGLDLQQPKANPGQRLLNVENPQNDLRYATVESAAISLLYPDSTIPIKGQKATRMQVMTTMQTDEQLGVFHFTGHGQHDINQPLESSLLLAGADQLTLRDIFQIDLSRYHLICLSACETALTSKQGLIDEFVGLVSGFLAKGATYVVSTLWAVDEYSTALLMVRFYQYLQEEKMPPPSALKAAQKWLRTVTHLQLIKWYQSLAAQFEDKNSDIQFYLNQQVKRLQKDSAKIDSDQSLYAHPYYWAGFTVTGKV